MSKKEIEIYVDKDNKVELRNFIKMKIKYDIEYQKKDKEIERLNENNQAMQEEMARTWKKLYEKENIIEEARKYIEDACWLDEVNKPNSLGHKQTIKLLEILKGSDKE